MRAFIQIDRLDLAQKELGTMQGIDDDATATQLATAWLDIALVPLPLSHYSTWTWCMMMMMMWCCVFVFVLGGVSAALQRELTQRCTL